MSQDLKTAPMTWIEEAGPSLEPGRLTSSDKKRVLPLAGLEISSRVLAGACDTDMIQRFENPYGEAIEAVYTFPLPGAAAVYAFELKVGERIVKGKVQERNQARAAYQQALDQGHRAALMEQERDDVFTMQVGNLPAGESLEVRLSFCQQLDFREEGLFELRLPTVVAPRYIPGQIKDSLDTGHGVESDTNLVPDASRISPPRLAPGFDPKIDFKLSIELLLPPGESLSQLACSQHITQTSLSSERVIVELARDAERLNRDFVLRWRDQAGLDSRLSYMQGPEAAYGLLQLVAPASAALLQTGRDVIFLVDRSGSMGDYKMISATQACSLLLNSLGPRDRYAVLAFDDQMEWFENDGSLWQTADEAGRAKGHRYLDKIESRGGTELFEAIQQSLQKVSQRGETTGNAPILVLLTDGQVGDESRILKAIQQELDEAVVYTIGIDTAVNDSFLTRLARLGGGTSVSVSPGEKLASALKQIAGEIGYPALWDLEAGLPENSPDPIPDLYQGRSLSVFFKGELPLEPLLKANGAQGAVRMHLKPQPVDFPALPRLWAKARIQALEDRFRIADQAQKQKIREDIIALSLEHQLLCRFTAWLAVDESEVIAGHEDRRQVIQPVETPDAWQAMGGTAMPIMQAMPMAPPPPIMPSPIVTPSPMPSAPMPPSAMPKSAMKRSAPAGAPRQMAKTESLDQSFGSRGGGGLNAPLDDLAPPASPGARASSAADSFAESAAPEADEAMEVQAPARAEGGLLGKIMEWVSPSKPQASEASRSRAQEPSRDKEQAKKAQPNALQKLISAFLSQLSEALTDLGQGKALDTAALTASREALLTQLSQSEGADRLPALQRLLRQESARLLKALNAESHEGLEPLIERCRTQLELARSESPADSFWEQTI
jgi:Ca-activated chloride channel family protein